MTEGCDLHDAPAARSRLRPGRTKFPPTAIPEFSPRSTPALPKPSASISCTTSSRPIPAEWSSPPFDAALVDKPGLGKVLIGRGAVNQKGPEATWLAALHAFKAAGKKAACEPGVCGGGRGRNRFAAFHAGRAPGRCSRGAEKMHRRLHAHADAGPRRHGDHQPGRQRRGRTGTGLQFARSGIADRRRIYIPATKHASIVPSGI